MSTLSWLATGGFAKGYRTYILSGVGAITVIALWTTGDQSTADSLHALRDIALSLSVGAARAGFGQ